MNFLCLIFGVFIWTFGEYILHRFLFHGEDYWLPNNPKFLASHFLMHGIHHAFPMDGLRLVFPVIPGYMVFFSFFGPLIKLLTPEAYSSSIIASTAVGYVLYDMIHYFLHHSQPKDGYWRGLKQYHL
jgi:sterol desaturase/sphingolipid hydroxylase (fatty acid hydroxylase superfamily)